MSEPYFLEVLPLHKGGTGPREIGPWATEAQRDATLKRLERRNPGTVYTKRAIAGRPGILQWHPSRPWGTDYVFGGWPQPLDEDRRRALEVREGETLRPFQGLSLSMYRHKQPYTYPALRIVPAHEWCNIPRPDGSFAVSNWPRGDQYVDHWIGPGYAETDLGGHIDQANSFVRAHTRRGWIWGGYSYSTCDEPGVVLEWRGANRRTAATGNNVGNGKMSILIAAGTENPDPGNVAWNNVLLLQAHLGLGRGTGHYQWTPTACPGPAIKQRL